MIKTISLINYLRKSIVAQLAAGVFGDEGGCERRLHMSSRTIDRPGDALLYGLAALLRAAAGALAVWGTALDAWLDARLVAAAARRELSAMSDYELRDIGLARGDIEYVASGGARDLGR
jgi:uncharacterized protein YjiS (DUF1127 family)